jgi:hypothetical protein
MYPFLALRLTSPIVVTIQLSLYFQSISCIYHRLASLKIAERQPFLAKKW